MNSDTDITPADGTPLQEDSGTWSVDPRRTRLMEWATGQVGKLYRWGAKGPDNFDCSGLVTAGLLELGLPDWRMTHNASRLFAELVPTDNPLPMDLVFYGQPEHVSHVVFFYGDGRILGACGGNQGTTTNAVALATGAAVKFRKSVNYRPDCRGFRKLPTPRSNNA